MTERTLLSALHALQQRRVHDWPRLDAGARRVLREAIDEVGREIARREHGRRRFAGSRKGRT